MIESILNPESTDNNKEVINSDEIILIELEKIASSKETPKQSEGSNEFLIPIV